MEGCAAGSLVGQSKHGQMLGLAHVAMHETATRAVRATARARKGATRLGLVARRLVLRSVQLQKICMRSVFVVAVGVGSGARGHAACAGRSGRDGDAGPRRGRRQRPGTAKSVLPGRALALGVRRAGSAQGVPAACEAPRRHGRTDTCGHRGRFRRAKRSRTARSARAAHAAKLWVRSQARQLTVAAESSWPPRLRSDRAQAREATAPCSVLDP